MGVAPTVAIGPLTDNSIFNFARNISNYLCTILVLLSKSAQSISLSALLLYFSQTTAAQNEDALSYRRVRGL